MVLQSASATSNQFQAVSRWKTKRLRESICCSRCSLSSFLVVLTTSSRTYSFILSILDRETQPYFTAGLEGFSPSYLNISLPDIRDGALKVGNYKAVRRGAIKMAPPCADAGVRRAVCRPASQSHAKRKVVKMVNENDNRWS